jgi:hypothetical protein
MVMNEANLTAKIPAKQAVSYFATREQIERILSLLQTAKSADSKLDDALSDEDISKALVNLGVMEDCLAEAEQIARQIQFSQEIKTEAETQ